MRSPSSASARAAGGRPSRSASVRSSAASRVRASDSASASSSRSFDAARRARGSVCCGTPQLGAVGERLLRGRQPRAQPGDRLEPKRQPLPGAAQAVERGGRLLAPCPPRRSAPPRPRSARASSASSRSLTWRRASPAAVRRSSPSASRPPSAARSSCAIRARSEAISPTSFSARSAAVAWSASGRSRFLTSASTSRARSTWIATRCELQLGAVAPALEAPEPRGLLDHLAPLARATTTSTSSTLPCADDRVHRRRRARGRRAARRGRCGGRPCG